LSFRSIPALAFFLGSRCKRVQKPFPVLECVRHACFPSTRPQMQLIKMLGQFQKSKFERTYNQKLRIGFGASISPLISKLCWMSRLATFVAAVYNKRESTSASLTLNTISCSLSSNLVSCPVDRYARHTPKRPLPRTHPILTVTIVMSNQVLSPDPTGILI
jgi:hypothetical protein